MADGNGHAVLPFQGGDLEAVFERLGDRLFGVDMLASFGDHLRQRQVLLVGDGQDHAL